MHAFSCAEVGGDEITLQQSDPSPELGDLLLTGKLVQLNTSLKKWSADLKKSYLPVALAQCLRADSAGCSATRLKPARSFLPSSIRLSSGCISVSGSLRLPIHHCALPEWSATGNWILVCDEIHRNWHSNER